MRPPGTANELETRRRCAVAMVQDGLSPAETCRYLGLRSGTLSRWLEVYRRWGDKGLASKKHPGPRPRLTRRQQRSLARCLLAGPRANGYPTDLWTGPRIAELIQRHYHVAYHVDHIGRLLRRLDFSPQRPTRQAVERDPAVIQHWIQTDWPRIKKKRHADTLV